MSEGPGDAGCVELTTTSALPASPPPPPPVPSAGTYVVGDSGFSVYEEMSRQLQCRGWRRRPVSQAALSDLVLGDRFQIPYAKLRCAQLPSSSFFGGVRWLNYFQGSSKLTQKAAMAELLREVDPTSASWMPESFVLGGPQQRRADERAAFLAAVLADPQSTWIVKPSSGAKGEEIVLVRGEAEAVRFIEGHLPLDGRRRYVAQRYVAHPLLLSHRRKFDVRVWALVASPYSIYAFSQGSCRTASVPFDLADIHNVHSHLTNHCLQESSEGFGQFEAGNEMWFASLEKYLVTGAGVAPGSLESTVLPQIADVLVRSLLALKPLVEVGAHEPFRCFQLFGYDFIIEADLGVKLLEINGSPGIAEHFLPSVVTCMLDLLGCGQEGAGGRGGTRVRSRRRTRDGGPLIGRNSCCCGGRATRCRMASHSE